MTRAEKRIYRLLNRKDATYRAIEALLKSAGYELARIKGSHHVFKRSDGEMLVFPVHNNLVKRCYLKEIIRKINPDPNEKI